MQSQLEWIQKKFIKIKMKKEGSKKKKNEQYVKQSFPNSIER